MRVNLETSWEMPQENVLVCEPDVGPEKFEDYNPSHFCILSLFCSLLFVYKEFSQPAISLNLKWLSEMTHRAAGCKVWMKCYYKKKKT